MSLSADLSDRAGIGYLQRILANFKQIKINIST